MCTILSKVIDISGRATLIFEDNIKAYELESSG
jgi:hypothetical protein